MSQIIIEKDLVEYTLPYPTTYQEIQGTRAAEFTSYTGVASRDYPATMEKYPLTLFVGWEELNQTDANYINDVWIAMIVDIDLDWQITDPDGTARYCWLNPEQPNIQVQRYSDGLGDMRYNIRLSFITEDI